MINTAKTSLRVRKFKFTLYGFLIGALFAIFAGTLFGVIPILLIFGFSFGDLGQILVMFGYAGLYSVIFAIFPGALGGAYLASWLEKSERTPAEITRRGLLVGAVAGFVAAFAFVAIVFQFSMDWMTLGFGVLAIAVAAIISLLAARWLAKKKSKFIQQQT